jgi:hypothetical protein
MAGVEQVIIHDRPPNFEVIQAAFPKAVEPGVMFAYDGNIYNPSGKIIPPALIAHEEVHLKRQIMHGADIWWDHYLRDSAFRYHEELLAHVAEFNMQKVTKDRNFGAALLMRTAMRLVAPLYNYQPPRTLQEAMKDIRREIAHA